MVLGSPVKSLEWQPAKGTLEKAGLAGVAVLAVAAAALLLLLSAFSLRCTAAAPWRLWAGGVAITAKAAAAAAAQTRRKVTAAANEEECDLFDGEWVREGSGYPLYDSRDCPFLDVSFRFSENGRPNESYTKWR